MSFLPSHPGPLALRELMLRFPERAVLIMKLHEVVMRGPSQFSEAERELLFAFGSGVNACDFCHDTHKYTAQQFGVDVGLFEKLLDDVETAPVDDKLKPVLRYVRKLTSDPAKVVQADADAVFDAGWDESALIDAATVCALHNMMNRIVDGTGVAADDAAKQESGMMLSSIGYGGGAAMMEKMLEAKGSGAAE